MIRKSQGYVDRTGNIAIKPQFDDGGQFSQGVAAVNVGAKVDEKSGALIGGKWGFIDKTGVFLIEPKYDYAGKFSEGLAGVEIRGKWGYIDKTGKYVWKPTE
uniref:WG repeat-containing protein n=1 Tax=candidate division WOR-3 bacterium TaxID=2052148 RepID=A0A7C6ED69_UNCW3